MTEPLDYRPGQRVIWHGTARAFTRPVVIAAVRASVTDPGRQVYDLADPATGRVLLFAAMAAEISPDAAADPAGALAALGAVVSPDLGLYAAGELDASRLRCALCQTAPCQCPPFGTPEYFALLDARHGRRGGAR